MNLMPETKELHHYLKESQDIDYSHLLIREKVKEIYLDCDNQIARIRKAYEFVRDEIAHSCDINSSMVMEEDGSFRLNWV